MRHGLPQAGDPRARAVVDLSPVQGGFRRRLDDFRSVEVGATHLEVGDANPLRFHLVRPVDHGTDCRGRNL